MKQWQDVIQCTKSEDHFNIYHLDDVKRVPSAGPTKEVVRFHCLSESKYYLGVAYPRVYFTRREAECCFYLLQGATIAQAADALHLSARTVEFYVKNMKKKLAVQTKFQLTERLHSIGFLQRLQNQSIAQAD